MEPILLVCFSLLAHGAEAACRDARFVGTVLPLRAQQLVVAPTRSPAANRLRFRHDVSLTVPVAVGAPPQNVTMVLDTGSELSWLLCATGRQGSAAAGAAAMGESFRPRASATFAAVPYGSTQCSSRDLLARSLRSMFGCMSTAYDSSPNNAATVGLHALLRDAGHHAPVLVLHLRPGLRRRAAPWL